jgi:aminoglycoside phosphotransferase (APT) family kinase protein
MAKMHADEAEIDESLVRRLLTAQFPEWAGLPLARVESSGTDNAIFRLGDDMADRHGAATELAAFVAALHRIDPAGGPAPGAHNFGRGVPLALREDLTRNAITSCGNLIDTDAVIAAWVKALYAPTWDQPPVWIHGDLLPGNPALAGISRHLISEVLADHAAAGL